jgi:FkbM family methyltransferase
MDISRQVQRWLRSAASSLVGLGLPIPEIALSRLSEYAQLRRLLLSNSIDVALDVGANRGQYGHLLRRLGFQGEIHSFEPQPTAYEVLQRRCCKDPKWHCQPLPLGRRNQSGLLRINSTHPEMTSLLAGDDEYGATREQEVRLRRLDEVMGDLQRREPPPRLLLKLDTEGFDMEVFAGASRLLPLVAVIQTEVFVAPVFYGAPHYLEALADIETAGFELEHIAAVSKTSKGQLMCLNALFSRSIPIQ